jgi:hypothetical protein
VRPHVELVHDVDLIRHPAELPGGEGGAYQLNLCYDEENGAASTKVGFSSDWSRPAGYHHADTEWFVVSGEVDVGGSALGPRGYLRAPAGLKVPPVTVREGSEVLVFREYGDFGFTVSDSDWPDDVREGGNTTSSGRGSLTMEDSAKLPWSPNIYEGDSQRFLHIKILYRDPSPPGDHTKGFVTILGYAPPNWADHKVAHHPCFEEAYCLDGDMVYNFGPITPGAYFFRPARVKHGMFESGSEKGALWIFRLDGDLINWVTEDPQVHVAGTPKNYDPADPSQAPVIAGLPVRSRTIGPWDGRGR